MHKLTRKASHIQLTLAALILGLMLLPGRAGLAGTLPDAAYVAGISGRAQTYSLSCEARSAVDWAAFFGVTIDESEFLYGLPSTDNPEMGFVGYANDYWGNIPPASYGVHAEPVAIRLQAFGLDADAHKGMNWNDLRAEIAAGRPVIVWVIGQMWGGTPIEFTAADGSHTTVAAFEHTMLLIGYDESRVHVIDAASGWTQVYPLETFISSWAVLGNMAITLKSTPVEPATASLDRQPGKYIVQRGDYLVVLAKRFGITWQELAAANGISYPYAIYPAQELRLPENATLPTTLTEPTNVSGQSAVNLPYRISLPLVANGSMASIGSNELAIPTEVAAEQPTAAEPTADEPDTYTVQSGDFLIAVAERFNLDWHQLADVNDITYPYIIYPGQILKLR